MAQAPDVLSNDSGPAREVTIVLVHGACHGSWCWEEVEQPLASRGWAVSTVDLPLTSLRDDAAVVRAEVGNVKRKEGNAVLLAGHSYGGAVISKAGHDADALVYCAGSMPEPGESCADVMPRISTPELTDAVEISADGTLSILPGRAAAAFYNRCTEDCVARAVGRLRPMRLQALNEPVPRPAWLEVPASYIVCTDDHAMAPDYQRERAQRLGDYVVLDTDHSMFYSAHEQFIDRIDALARRLRDNAARTPV